MESPLIGPDCNWVCIACSKLLWNVRTMKWASVRRDSGESHGCCPRSTLLGLWFLIVLPVCHIFTICDKCIMQSLAVFVYFFLWGPWVTLFKMKIDVVGKCTSQGVQCITYYSWRISVSFFLDLIRRFADTVTVCNQRCAGQHTSHSVTEKNYCG